jgi:hypothetical protein
MGGRDGPQSLMLKGMTAEAIARMERDPPPPGHAIRTFMGAKTTAQTAKRKASGAKSKGGSKAAPPVVFTSARKIVAQNLVNMVVVMAGSGTVLLGLLAAKHFQLAQF